MSEGASIVEPWQPRVGDYVRVDPSPECRACHGSRLTPLRPLYGRVEDVDRLWDDPAEWLAAAIADGEDPADALMHAAAARGHFYYVSDALDTHEYLLLDEQCCALELTPVDAETATDAIAQLRADFAQLTRRERAELRLGAILGVAS